MHVLRGSGNALLGFPAALVPGVSGYRCWQGLLQLDQATVDGKAADPANFSGIRAAGVQVELLAPVLVKVQVTVTITPAPGVTTASLASDIRSAIAACVNGLGVGQGVPVAKLISVIKAVVGVQALAPLTPAANLRVASNALARVQETDITVG